MTEVSGFFFNVLKCIGGSCWQEFSICNARRRILWILWDGHRVHSLENLYGLDPQKMNSYEGNVELMRLGFYNENKRENMIVKRSIKYRKVAGLKVQKNKMILWLTEKNLRAWMMA